MAPLFCQFHNDNLLGLGVFFLPNGLFSLPLLGLVSLKADRRNSHPSASKLWLARLLDLFCATEKTLAPAFMPACPYWVLDRVNGAIAKTNKRIAFWLRKQQVG